MRDEPTAKKQRKKGGIGKPFPPGVSGNPNGRPRKGSDLTGIMREYMDGTIDTDGGTLTRGEALIRAIYKRALQGGDGAQTKMLQYLAGLPPQTIISVDGNEDKSKAQLYMIYSTLFTPQILLANSKKHRHVVIAGRRALKTTFLSKYYSMLMIQYPDAELIYVHLTAKNAWAQLSQRVIKETADVGYAVDANASKNEIRFGDGGVLRFLGNETKDDRERLRGFGKNCRYIGIDECQSQKELKYIVEEIIEPMTFDCNARIGLFGTRPRIPGTYFEAQWECMTLDAERVYKKDLNDPYTMFDNPYIPDARKQLDKLLIERGITENDPLIQREYFGRKIYDEEARVLRFAKENYFTDEQFAAWVGKGENRKRIRLIGGLDLGFDDADAIMLFAYCKTDRRIWAVYEKVVHRQGIEDCEKMIRDALEYGKTLTDDPIYLFYDSGGGGKKLGEDFVTHKKLPLYPAEKQGKDAAVELMQSDAHARPVRLMVRQGGSLDNDAQRIIFTRNELDQVVRIIDDDVYHSDIFDAGLYAHREVLKHIPRA
jgi:hypothetical protein